MNKQYALVATFGRLLMAAIFLVSGLGKVANPQMTQGYIVSAGLPFPLLAYLRTCILPAEDYLCVRTGDRGGRACGQ